MKLLFLAISLIAPTAALAWSDHEQFRAAESLGTVLASEEPCGLSYDHDAIRAYIDNTVPPDDMEFSGIMRGQTTLFELRMEDMSPSALTAHCRQIERVTKHFGFITD